ncbi:MAG: hypothetical protein WA906_04715 [Pacificimonas sp.]
MSVQIVEASSIDLTTDGKPAVRSNERYQVRSIVVDDEIVTLIEFS